MHLTARISLFSINYVILSVNVGITYPLSHSPGIHDLLLGMSTVSFVHPCEPITRLCLGSLDYHRAAKCGGDESQRPLVCQFDIQWSTSLITALPFRLQLPSNYTGVDCRWAIAFLQDHFCHGRASTRPRISSVHWTRILCVGYMQEQALLGPPNHQYRSSLSLPAMN